MNVKCYIYLLLAVLITLGTASAIPAATQGTQPEIAYETTITGYFLASGRGMAVDPDGNSYVFARLIGQDNDFLVIKLGAGGEVLWSTLIDGVKHDVATGIALDRESNPYITGWTDSPDFPILNGLDDTLTGFRDAFVMQLSTLDGAILYSTFLGGEYVDQGGGIALNDTDEIYLAGLTESRDFPTVDPIQDELNSPPYAFSDAFVTKISADGSAILYSTFLGGSRDDGAVSIGLDASDNIYISGDTDSTDMPTKNPIQGTNEGSQDTFVAQISADGSTLDYATYLGGDEWDRTARMVVDDAGQVYLTGSTRSIDFPTTVGAFQEDFVGGILDCELPFIGRFNCDDAFLSKLVAGGTSLVYSTYLGGTDVDESRDLAVDGDGNAYVVGYSVSPDFPPAGIGGPAAIFVSKMSPAGDSLDFTFIKNSGSANAGHGIALNAVDDIYFTGAINVPADIYIAQLTQAPVIVPDVTVSISSAMTQVSRNSEFLFDLEIANNEDAPQALQVWSAVQRLPDGPEHAPLRGPFTVTLGPGETRTFSHISQHVGNAPLATYRYYARVGQNAVGQPWDEDFWDIEVIP